MPSRQPTSWDEYDRGASPGRSDSAGSPGNQGSIRFEGEQRPLLSDNGESRERPALGRRRSSSTNPFAGLTDIGGVNSIRQFSRSWQRAAVFPEVIPQRPSFAFAPDQEPAHHHQQYARGDVEAGAGAGPKASLIREHLEAADIDTVGEDEDGATEPASHLGGGDRSGAASPRDNRHDQHAQEAKRQRSNSDLYRVLSSSVGSGSPRGRRSNSIFEVPPHLAAPDIAGSWGTYRSYGTVDADVDTVRSGDDISRPSMAHAAELWRQQQESGVNVPDGERPPILVKEVEQEGRIVLAVSGQSTLPQTVMNATNVLIGVGLLSLPMGLKYAGWVCGMVILGLCALVTSWTARILAKCMNLDPTMITFSDIAYISFGRKARIVTSVLFTLELLAACVALIVLFADSLALLFPGTLTVVGWKIVCALILIYRDMRHPYRFKEYLIDASVAVVGLLMFGDGVHDEITANILEEMGYPAVLHILLVIFISIIPLTKIPLNAQPIITTFEVLFGLRQQVVSEEGHLIGLSSASRGIMKAAVRIVTLLVFLLVAILFPAFDSIMAFMGSALCFTICVTLPLAFYLKLFGHEISCRERVFTWCVMLLSLLLSIVGTVWAFLPKSLIGAE
ncbi:hypothetical protein SLS62_009509 [Diatrype stigma]|uniref:Amino acid transporter transmembrane domain-containing protein n=1 Tax=Diatrype stigma TaxID=117547 RepID=A0AAN9UDG9_9PEZI